MEDFPEILVIALHCSARSRDLEAMRSDLAALDETGAHGPLFEAIRTATRGGIAALSGDIGEGLRLYRDARAALADLDVLVRTRTDGDGHGRRSPEREPRPRRPSTRPVRLFQRIGARPFLEQLDELAGPAVGWREPVRRGPMVPTCPRLQSPRTRLSGSSTASSSRRSVGYPSAMATLSRRTSSTSRTSPASA